MMGSQASEQMSEATGPSLDIPIPILHDLITSSVRLHGERPALVCRHQTADLVPEVFRISRSLSKDGHLQWTHAQLQYGADLLAYGLVKNGLRPGSTIAVILSGRAEFHMAIRAAVKLKCPFAPINLRSPQNAKEIKHMLTLCDAKAVIVENASVAEQLEANAQSLMGGMMVKVMAGDKSSKVDYLSLSDIVSAAANDAMFQEQNVLLQNLPRHIDDTVFIWFTSGTTSLPKAAPHTNRSLTCNIRSWQEAFELDAKRVWLQILPMNSIVGSSWTLAYLIPGGQIVHASYNFDADSIIQTIQDGGITDMLAVPSMLDLLASSPSLSSQPSRGIDRIIVGGSKILRSHVEKSFTKLKCKRFSPFFGMTEGTSVCTETLYKVPDSLDDPIYAGYASPGCTVRICAPEDTNPLPRGTPGEIVQGGYQKIERYLGGQGKDNFFTDNGRTWYRCGDQAVMLEDGRIAIVGRYKDMIIRGGMNIAAAAVEAVISEGTSIDSQIIGIPDEVAGEVPVAVIKHPQEDKGAATRVQRCVLERMGPQYSLAAVLNLMELGVDDWPKTTSGKVLKRDLQQMAQTLLQTKPETIGLHSPQQRQSSLRTLLDHSQLEQYLLERVQSQGLLVDTIDDDVVGGGLDSLLAARLQRAVLKNPELGPNFRFPVSAIFECGNIRSLANHLISLNSGGDGSLSISHRAEAFVDEMAEMVDKYSDFHRHEPTTSDESRGHTILLTGTTGSLGAHVLATLLDRDDVRAVYCPVRGEAPVKRLQESLSRRCVLTRRFDDRVKVIASHATGILDSFDDTTREELRQHLTLIIHAAWPVNFQLSLASFDPHLRDLHSLVQLSLDVRQARPARVLFCSSMGVATSTQGQRRIIEEPVMDYRQAASNGYTMSKAVAEHIVQNATEKFGAEAYNLRIGQIVGDTKAGLWNTTEAPPMMIQSALTLGCLPSWDMKCSWIPVDTLANAIIEIATLPREKPPHLVYNLCNPRIFSWSKDFLPALAAAGFRFDIVSFSEWLEKLKAYNSTCSAEEAVKSCPAVKLIDHWEASQGAMKSKFDGLEFATEKAQKDSKSMRTAPDVIKSGLVEVMLGAWLQEWHRLPTH